MARTVENEGVLYVSSGASVNTVTIAAAGTEIILSSGVASGNLNSGLVTVTGGATDYRDLVGSGGLEEVSSGGIASTTIISSGGVATMLSGRRSSIRC